MARTAVPLLYASRPGAARMARAGQVAAAIRIPERVRAQLRLVIPSSSPRLFVHEGARQALERRLRGAFGGPVVLSITDNRHSIITHRVQKGSLHVRVHHMVLDAPAVVGDALVRYVIAGGAAIATPAPSSATTSTTMASASPAASETRR